MSIINFRPTSGDSMDIETMSVPELTAYLAALQQELAELDAREPKNKNSEAFESWGDAHEDLEDLLDDVQDRLDELAESSR